MRDVPNYSTDIYDAWRVVEKISEGDINFELYKEFATEDREDINWVCDVGSSVEVISATASTAPLAICLAALKAKKI